ncbi:hypothetical protein G7066_04480 [Leucobacter coleopterorum]|uniref:Uncharacterized protein n=1 Tax=Leucobacter coleopterorum TaxID=2714933 RepID=A0ABX6JUW6_9MICO|nr:hypothetical protein [Leucobacter coleopterorum]QIM18099.1 hypothetical protein G7066_04480 [Leucobacter coleopterorum]
MAIRLEAIGIVGRDVEVARGNKSYGHITVGNTGYASLRDVFDARWKGRCGNGVVWLQR